MHAHTDRPGLPRDESLQACCRGHSLGSLGTPMKSVLTLSLTRPHITYFLYFKNISFLILNYYNLDYSLHMGTVEGGQDIFISPAVSWPLEGDL